MSNSTHVSLATMLIDGGDYLELIHSLTGRAVGSFLLDELLDPLGHPFRVIDPIETAIVDCYTDDISAAFAAGIAVGLDPGRVLLARHEKPVSCIE